MKPLLPEADLMDHATIRLAKPEDAPDIVAIYNYYISQTTATFNTQARSQEKYREYIERIGRQYPWLVVEQADEIIGYAFAHEERAIDAYAWNVELAIFLKKDVTAVGLGTRLMEVLLDILSYAGYKNAYSVISSSNDASFALHEKFGFELVGTHTRTGFKQGEWRDTTWLVKRLGSFDDIPPAPVLMPEEWDWAEIEHILSRR